MTEPLVAACGPTARYSVRPGISAPPLICGPKAGSGPAGAAVADTGLKAIRNMPAREPARREDISARRRPSLGLRVGCPPSRGCDARAIKAALLRATTRDKPWPGKPCEPTIGLSIVARNKSTQVRKRNNIDCKIGTLDLLTSPLAQPPSVDRRSTHLFVSDSGRPPVRAVACRYGSDEGRLAHPRPSQASGPRQASGCQAGRWPRTRLPAGVSWRVPLAPGVTSVSRRACGSRFV